MQKGTLLGELDREGTPLKIGDKITWPTGFVNGADGNTYPINQIQTITYNSKHHRITLGNLFNKWSGDKVRVIESTEHIYSLEDGTIYTRLKDGKIDTKPYRLQFTKEEYQDMQKRDAEWMAQMIYSDIKEKKGE